MGGFSNVIGDLKVLYSALTRKSVDPAASGSIAQLVQQQASDYPNGVALLCEGQTLTWTELNKEANRIAAQLKAQGVESGDCISLFMQNRIGFVTTMLAIGKLGAIAGMINTNLTKQPLVHCINLINSSKCIFGEELTNALEEVRDELKLDDGADYLYVADQGETPPPNWAIALDPSDASHGESDPIESANVKLGDTAFYIFTSGTTGLPKAAIVSSKRILPNARIGAESLLRIKRSDRMYNCLPLYHGTGLILGLATAFTVGASSVIKRRLSITSFWDDIRRNNCTSFVYIGEFIRYLMSAPASHTDTDNPVRTIVGNGLRPDIWHHFKDRFNIERIGEFYAASEGNGGFANVFNKDCTVGVNVAPVKLIAYDIANDEIIRGSDGFCHEVALGEPGLLLIQVTARSHYEGYTNQEASEQKLLRDVFEEGDLYFNSGDLMKTIDVGFAWFRPHYQFVDRIGDTFRWKSENVSTTEVSDIVSQHKDVDFCVVYGVEIPGTDGRAGMAAIVLAEGRTLANMDLAGLSTHIRMNLPVYAQPIFIRILKELPTTTTHKLQKNRLQEDAFHLDQVLDDLLVLKPSSEKYTLLDADFYDQIVARGVRF